MLALAAEGAIERIFRIAAADLGHGSSPCRQSVHSSGALCQSRTAAPTVPTLENDGAARESIVSRLVPSPGRIFIDPFPSQKRIEARE
jgi:hypothetical protein